MKIKTINISLLSIVIIAFVVCVVLSNRTVPDNNDLCGEYDILIYEHLFKEVLNPCVCK